ncbi:MAG: tRNA (N6-isopentenyl adenosine(37)-C2)-methylthiotransferase MiaB [Coriobacteriia bacterium]|nr:tRNA (N6-isopentenyl adenosine(37)-C2)-methylthiotransferase MiaB [Coriobacteriia bacterium]
MIISELSGKTYHVIIYGCQMNKHDGERIAGMLDSLGATRVDTIEESDIVIFVTCCVREAADVRLMGQAASLKNVPLREGAPVTKRIVAIGGCIGQRDGDKLVDTLPHIDVVFGTFNLSSLPRLLEQTILTGEPMVEVLDSADEFPTSLPSQREHSWAAWLPISIGCNNFCTYCIVPHVRGREKSRPMEDVLADARAYVADGVKEITLLGQNVNSYGRDLYGEPRFAELLRQVSATGIERIRFATSHPKDLNDEVIQAFAELPNLMPALHLPVQSGSNAILKKMNRKYTREHYLDIVRKLREVRPDIALSTDIIVGFPGETEEDFQQTYDLVREVGYHQVFTFIYSPREGTPAAKMILEDDTPREVIQERFQRLVDLVQEGAFAANQPEAGKVVPVLVEGSSRRDETMLTGRSPKNLTVHAHIPEGSDIDELKGTFVDVKINKAKTWYLAGEVL